MVSVHACYEKGHYACRRNHCNCSGETDSTVEDGYIPAPTEAKMWMMVVHGSFREVAEWNKCCKTICAVLVHSV